MRRERLHDLSGASEKKAGYCFMIVKLMPPSVCPFR
jgi:hypothetical protein